MNPNYWRQIRRALRDCRIPETLRHAVQSERMFEAALAVGGRAVPFVVEQRALAEVSEAAHAAAVAGTLRLPFPAVRIELTPNPEIPHSAPGVLLLEHIARDGVERLLAWMFRWTYGEQSRGFPRGDAWTLDAVCTLDPAPNPDGGVRFGSAARPIGDPRTNAEQGEADERAVVIAARFLALLGSPGARIADSPGNASKPKIKAKHLARGALPFDDYRVVVIDPEAARPEPAPEPTGGTHRSPREHLRRGHVRHLLDGRSVFVRATVVGRGAAGSISKHYVVEAAR